MCTVSLDKEDDDDDNAPLIKCYKYTYASLIMIVQLKIVRHKILDFSGSVLNCVIQWKDVCADDVCIDEFIFANCEMRHNIRYNIILYGNGHVIC